MDIHKITNFNNEYNGKEFPAYYHLSKFESKKIHNTIASKLNMSKDHSSLDLVVKISQIAVQIQGIDADSDSFNLKQVLSNAGVSPKSEVFINWHRFDDIDQISLDDLTKYFDDIWYPAADSIDIFDSSFLWILEIDYSGAVSLLKLS